MRLRSIFAARLWLIIFLLAGIVFQPQLNAYAAASLTIVPITWNVVGLDSNNINVGPSNYPVGARVCNTGDATANNLTVDFVWDDGLNDYTGDPYINLRTGSYSSIAVPSLAAATCKDFYFEINVARNVASYNKSRDYHITADSNETDLISTPTPREIFVEHLVSQNRNSVTDVKLDGVSIAAGGTMNLMVGSTYVIQLVAATATNGYEQIESFINFPNTIFQVNSVVASYSAFPTPHTDPNWASKLYADGCGWVNDPNDIIAPAYRECTGSGKYGGNITISYNVTIIGGGGTNQTLNTLIYDFSGSSYHYNSDFGSSSRIASITTPSACTDGNRVPIAAWNFNDQNTIVDSLNGMSGVMNVGTGITTGAYLLRATGNYAHQSGNWSSVTANQEYLEFVASTLGFTGIKVSFDAAQDNNAGPDNVAIQYSTNGTNFATNSTTAALSGTFTPFTDDLSAVTALDNNVNAKFRLVGTGATQDSRFLQLDNVSISGCPLPRGLSLSKSANPVTYTGTGQAVTYTYTLVNTGLAPLRAPFDIIDNREPAVAVSCAAASSPLAPGASTTCTGTYTTTGADVAALSVTNTASATGTFNSVSVSSNTTAATITYPALNVIKEVSADNSTWNDTSITVSAGDPVYYRIRVDNTGGAHLTGVTVEEDMAGCTLAGPTGDVDADNILDPEETWIYTCSLVALAGTNNNTATGDSAETGPDTDAASYFGSVPSLNAEKTSTTTAITAVGQLVPYIFTVTNTGNTTLTGITVSDPKCDAAPVLQSGDTSNDSQLQTTETWLYTCNHTVSQSEVDAGGNLGNTVSVDSTESSPDSASLTIPVTQTPALTIAKSVTETSYASVGNTLNYSYLVTNSGNVTLGGPFTVTDDKAADEACPATATLAPGVSITCTASYMIVQADLDVGSVTNSASAGALFGGNPVTSAPDTETVTAFQAPALNIVKTASPKTYDTVGDVVSYSYAITNSSNVTLTGPFTVADDKAADESCPAIGSLVPGAGVTCTANYTITQADLDAGTVTNIASASGLFGGNAVTSAPDTETVTALQSPALTVVKTANPLTYSNAGAVIGYSYLVTNSGNVTLTGPFTIADDKSADESCPVTASLASGESLTCTASYTVAQGDLDSGSVTNVASAHGFFGASTVDSATDSQTVNATQAPALGIAKSVTETSYAAGGDVLHYSYLVINSGNVTLSGPFGVIDDKATDEACPAAASLAPSMSITCTASYTVTQADLDTGSVTNIASATNGAVTSGNDTETVLADQNPALTIVKTANPTTYRSVGAVIGYSYEVTNSGNVTLNGPFSVSDDKSLDEWCPNTATLAPAEHITCTATYTITQADLDGGNVINNASATGSFGGKAVTSAADTETVTAVQAPALSVVKSVTEASYASVGNVLHYSYLVTNTGNVTLSGPFSVADDKAADESCSVTATLAPGAGITCTATYTVTQADLDAGSVTNVASATNGMVTSSADTVTVPAAQAPALTVAKRVTELSYDAVSDVLHYSYLVTNSGNVTVAAPFTITDNKATDEVCPATATLLPGGTLNCTATYTITQADLDAGFVTNVAAAHATFGGNPVDSAPDNETVNALQSPALTIDKSVTEVSYTSVGNVLHYSYLVTNSGNVTLSGPFTVADDRSTDEACPATPSLVPGASITCTATYTITANDINNASVTNVASAHGFFGSTAVDSGTDSKTVNLAAAPSLLLTKTPALDDTVVAPSGLVNAGDTITYTFSVQNTGNVTVIGIVVTDPLLPALSCTIASLPFGQSASCAGTNNVYVLTQADVDAGARLNTATATGKDPADNDVSDSAARTTGLPASPSIVLTKTPVVDDTAVKPDGVANAGDIITYSFSVENTGNVTITGVVVVDPLLPGLICAIPSIAPGATESCSPTENTYTLTQADVDAGSRPNAATATGKDPDNKDVTDSDTQTVLLTPVPSIAVNKTGTLNDDDGTPGLSAGDTISYAFAVTNTGNVSLTGITLTDTVGGVTISGGPIASLAPGATDTTTFTGSYALTVSYINTGTFINTATVAGTPPSGPTATGSDDDTQPLTFTPAIVLTKTATLDDTAVPPGGVVNAGDTITYTFSVENTGDVTITSITITDPLLPALSCSIPSLAPGATTSCTATNNVYRLSQADVNTGSRANTATATGKDPGNNDTSDSDSQTTSLPGAASIVLTKSATLDDSIVAPNGVANAGDIITYTFSVENTGNVTVASITVSDPLLPGLTCGISSLAPGATASCIAASNLYTLTQVDVDAGSRTNTASATGQDPSGNPVTDPDSQTVSLTLAPSLQLAKTGTLNDDDGVPGISAGDTISYAFTVTNDGNVTLTDITLADTIGGVTISGGAIPSLAPGASDASTFTGAYTLTTGDINAGTFTNTATATGTAPDGSDATVADDDVQALLVQPSIVLSKGATVDDTVVAPAGVVNAGDRVAYTFSVENTGNVTVTNITVTDPRLPALGCAIASLAPGGTTSCTPTNNIYTLTQADVDAGLIVNSATATAADPGNNAVTDSDTQSTNLGQSPRLALTKTGTLDDTVIPPSAMANAGDAVTYTFSVANTGNVTITNISVTDPLLPGLTCALSSLAPGASASCTPTNNVYILTQTDIDAGARPNTATATGKDPADQNVTDTDTQTTTIAKSPSLRTVKEVSADNKNWNDVSVAVTVGNTVHYRVRVSNTGNTTQTGLMVDDGMAACTLVRDTDLTGNNDNVFEAGEEWAYTCSVTAELGMHNNTVTAATNETSGASDSASYVAGAVQVADPAIAKVGDPTQASVGDTVMFTLTVTNGGNAPAPNIVITDVLPAIFDVTAVNVRGAPLGTLVNVTPLIGTGPGPYTVIVTLGGDLGVTDVVTIDIVTIVNSLGNPPINNTASLTTSAVTDIASNNATSVTITIRDVASKKLPATGFARDRTTLLAPQSPELAYAPTDLVLEIPGLSIRIPVVGVPKKNGAWNVSWLGSQAGWLQGSAFPSWNGNSLLTSHVYLSNGLPGPFVHLNKLKYGDQIIVHAYGEKYTFAVQTNAVVEANDVSALKHEAKPWLTLITCQEFDEKTNTYLKRVVVRAVLISVTPE